MTAPSAARPTRLAAATCAAAALLAAGCASTAPIDGARRDADGTFDGVYSMSMPRRERGFQNVGNWRLSCATAGFDHPIRVADGRARIVAPRFPGASDPSATVASVVDERGRFRFEVPMERVVSASGTSDRTVDDGAVVLIYTGALSPEGPSKGRYTAGIGEFGNRGCTYATTIEPVRAGA